MLKHSCKASVHEQNRCKRALNSVSQSCSTRHWPIGALWHESECRTPPLDSHSRQQCCETSDAIAARTSSAAKLCPLGFVEMATRTAQNNFPDLQSAPKTIFYQTNPEYLSPTSIPVTKIIFYQKNISSIEKIF